MIDYDEFFKYQAMALRYTRGHPDTQKNWKWALTFLPQHGLFTFAAICYVYTMIKYDVKAGDFVAACTNISLITIWPVVSFFYVILIKYERSFKIMTASMKKDYATASTLSPEEQDVVLQYATKGKLVTKIWIAISFFCFLVSIVKTQVIMLYYTIIGETRYLYIVKFYIPGLPEDFTNSLLGYYVTFFMTSYYFLYCCMMYPGMATMGPILMLHASGQLELLRITTMQLYPKNESVTLQQRMIKLNTIAIRLQEIYDFVDHINRSHKMMFEMTLKGAAVIVPVLFYQLLGSFRQGQVDIEFTFFVMVGGCVFCAFPCFYGDILMSKSEELQLALYECGWESVWERRVRSSLLLMMTRTSRAVAIRTVFRTISLEALADFIKRLEDSYKVLKKQQGSEEYYTGFVDELRALCFNSLIPGANYSRRVVALQVLLWTEQIHMDGYDRIWNEDYGEKLLVHLEDSYENNKAFALEILNKCPVSLITSKRYSISLEIEDILRQASSMKPTDCVSAAYKLDLLRSKLPEKIPQENSNNISEAVTFSLLQRLHTELLAELATCARSIVSAAINAPMYGLLHCMVHLITKIDTRAISANKEWSVLVSDIIDTCFRVNASVACVVNNSSPEGHLPMDMGGVEVTDHGNSGGVRLEDGRQVTAQMVLLCAWRSVKEVSLLLGEISSRLTITGEDGDGTLTPALMILIGEHFTKLLAETKHRGAFEQAYVGFTKLLARLWRCRTASLHELPSGWLRELMAAIATGDRRGMLCATRRSAGLPFMIQALVTTELQVQGNPKCFHQCMTTLLRLARAPDTSMRQTETAIETRTHSINILRALFRNSALDESVAGYVGEGLVVTLEGFEGGTWMERNSSTLLFSALMVRIFGVQRSKDSENLCVRNRMTGRIFFLRYPHLYDFMLNKLKEVSCSEDTQVLRPSLYPILLLLARLYPSSLEGTISNLKLVAYIPHVLACARSGVLKTRQLAAKAMVPLISPEQYIQHLESMLPLICNQDIKRNFCHGILLQLIRLIDSKPESLTIEVDAATRLSVAISNTYWILEQATSTGRTPCYLLADEYVKMINLVLWRFPSLMSKETVNAIEILLENLLFTEDNVSIINSGRDICLANALYLYLIILNSHYKEDLSKLCVIVCKSLKHKSYEVTLAILNFLLILYDNLEIDNKFEEHLSLIANKDVLKQFSGNPKYVETLCEVLKSNKYLECTQKALKVLALEKDTEKCVVQAKNKDKLTNITDDMILQTLLNCINEEHENLTHIYLESLSNFINKKLNSSSAKVTVILEVIRLILACSSSDNSENTRKVVVSFLENNIRELFMLDLGDLTEEEKFEYKATLYATLVTVLEDDDEDIRQRTSNVIMSLRNNVTSHTYDVTPVNTKVISTKAAEVLRDLIVEEENSLVLFVVLALLDFKSEVCMTDEVNDECRVFDHNERYNIFLEETVWTSECADKIIHLYGTRTDPMNLIQNLLQDNIYRKTIEKLCNNNFILFEKIACDFDSFKNSAINPKIGLFVDRLKK